MLEHILVKVVAMEVIGLKLAKSAWKERDEMVISRLKPVCSQWNSLLTTISFRTKLHRILDGTGQLTNYYLLALSMCTEHLNSLIRNTILSVLFCPPFCPIPFCLYTILSIPFCPYHFVRYHFVQEPILSLTLINVFHKHMLL